MNAKYTRLIEELDRKAGRTHTVDDWQRVSDKEPQERTDDDLTVLGYFSGEKRADEARAQREKALAPAAPVAKADTKDGNPYVRLSGLRRSLEGFVKALAPMLKTHSDRLDVLEQRLAGLEARPAMKFAGTWRSGATFEKGDTVVHRSAVWTCRANTVGEPGRNFDDWQLILKSSRDNR